MSGLMTNYIFYVFSHIFMSFYVPFKFSRTFQIQPVPFKFMIRTAWFVKEFNGYKGTRMTLADFFTSSEILNLKQNYLDANGRPTSSVGSHASGSYGDVDEIEENADIVHLR